MTITPSTRKLARHPHASVTGGIMSPAMINPTAEPCAAIAIGRLRSRSIRAIGDWQGAPLRLNENFPEGQDVAVILEAPDGRIVCASKPLGG
jgi:hypothetical protein